MKTNPKVVIRRNGAEQYMDKQGNWGDYKQAKRFASDDEADTFAQKHGVTDHGLFRCSVPYNRERKKVRHGS